MVESSELTVSPSEFKIRTRISPTEVTNFFLNEITTPISQEDADKIAKLPYWERKQMTARDLSPMTYWHYNPNNPSREGQILTNWGKSQSLDHAAKAYLDSFSLLKKECSDFISKIEGIRKVMQKGIAMPPLLIVAGRGFKPPSLVDGNSRALALAVQQLSEPQKDWRVEAFIGRKFYPFENLLK